jgi:zinc protease
MWLAYAIFAPQNGAKLEASFRDELQRVLKDGFTPEEIRAAKNGWLQEQQLSRAQDRELAGQLGMQLDTRRTMAYTEDLERKVMALTSDHLLKALRAHLDLSKLTVIKAGDFAKVP